MKINVSPRRRHRLSFTPIIDVVFLLLLFFMLASTFTRFAHVDVTLGGKASVSTDQQRKPIVLISIRAAKQFSVNGRSVTLEQIQPTLQQLSNNEQIQIVVRPNRTGHCRRHHPGH